MASGPTISWQIEGEKVETVTDVIFILKSLWMVTAAMKLKDTWPWKEMAIHSSILAWKILWTKEPGGTQSTGL